jgi:hypothetical protein
VLGRLPRRRRAATRGCSARRIYTPKGSPQARGGVLSRLTAFRRPTGYRSYAHNSTESMFCFIWHAPSLSNTPNWGSRVNHCRREKQQVAMKAPHQIRGHPLHLSTCCRTGLPAATLSHTHPPQEHCHRHHKRVQHRNSPQTVLSRPACPCCWTH